MTLLPHLLNGIAIPAAASLLTTVSTKTDDSSSKKNAFSSLLKSELDNQANSSRVAQKTADQVNNPETLKKLEERLKKLAAEINNAARAEIEKTKDALSASISGSMTVGNFLAQIDQSSALKIDNAQLEKLRNTNANPSAPTPEVDSQTKITGDNASLVLIAGKDKIYNTGLDRYRMESLAANKKGISGGNLLVGLRIPMG